jgi:hypothetical protein
MSDANRLVGDLLSNFTGTVEEPVFLSYYRSLMVPFGLPWMNSY